jgi:hypothetical protein
VFKHLLVIVQVVLATLVVLVVVGRSVLVVALRLVVLAVKVVQAQTDLEIRYPHLDGKMD